MKNQKHSTFVLVALTTATLALSAGAAGCVSVDAEIPDVEVTRRTWPSRAFPSAARSATCR